MKYPPLSAAMSLLALGFLISSARAENVAIGKEVVGFSAPTIMHVPFDFAADQPGKCAVDGNPETAASNYQSFPWVIELRLGKVFGVDRIVLETPEGGNSSHYFVQVAGDGYDWQTIEEVKGDGPGRREFKFSPRWVSRVRIDSRSPAQLGSPDGRFAPSEVEVYSSSVVPASPAPVLLAPLADAPPESYVSRYPIGDEAEDRNCAPPDWLMNTFRRAHVDMHTWDMDKRAEIISKSADSGMKLLVTPCWNQQFTYFPSKLAAMSPELNGKKDLFRQTIDLVHGKGMRFGVYHCPATSPRLLENPRWIMRNLLGELQVNAGWYEGCWNSPYADYYIDRLVEISTNYPIDTFWLDGLWVHEGCACDYCKVKFEKQTGRAFPTKFDYSDHSFLAWREWRGRQTSEALRRIRRALSKVRPELTFITNTYTTQNFPLPYPWASSYESQYMPSVSEEHGLSFITDMTFHQFMANYVRSVAGDNRDAELWLFQGTNLSVPLVDLRLRALTQIAAGAKPDIAAEVGGWDRLKTVFGDIEAREPWLKGTNRVKWAALLVSDRTRYFDAARRAQGGWPTLENVSDMWSYERGLYRAMIEEHLPVTMITDADLEAGRLDGYKVLLLGNTTCLDEKSVAAIERFVDGGGGLLATHNTSGRTGWGVERDNFSLAALLGGNRLGTVGGAAGGDGQVRLSERAKSLPSIKASLDEFRSQLMTGNEPAEFLPWTGPMTGVVATDPESVLLSLETAEGKWPFLISRKQGQGRVAYFPGAIDHTLFSSSTPWAAKLIAQTALDVAAEPPPVEVRAPAIVAATVFDQPAQSRLVVHLLNDYSSQGRVPANNTGWTRRDFATLADLTVTVRGKTCTRATLEPGNTPLPITQVGSDCVIEVPRLDMHRMVVVEYAPKAP